MVTFQFVYHIDHALSTVNVRCEDIPVQLCTEDMMYLKRSNECSILIKITRD